MDSAAVARKRPFGPGMAVHSASHNLHVQQTAAGAPAIHTAGTPPAKWNFRTAANIASISISSAFVSRFSTKAK